MVVVPLVAPSSQSSESYARSSSTTTIGGACNDASTATARNVDAGGGEATITAVAATRNERGAGVVAAKDTLERTECAGGVGMGEVAAAEPVCWNGCGVTANPRLGGGDGDGC